MKSTSRRFRTGDSATTKLRPVLILAGPVGSAADMLVAYISPVMPTDPLSTDLVIDPTEAEHQNTNLKTTSVLRLQQAGNDTFEECVTLLGQDLRRDSSASG